MSTKCQMTNTHCFVFVFFFFLFLFIYLFFFFFLCVFLFVVFRHRLCYVYIYICTHNIHFSLRIVAFTDKIQGKQKGMPTMPALNQIVKTFEQRWTNKKIRWLLQGFVWKCKYPCKIEVDKVDFFFSFFFLFFYFFHLCTNIM